MSKLLSFEDFKSTLRNDIGAVMSYLVLEIKKELREQGHILTGNLERSIQVEIKEDVNRISFLIYLEEYGLNIDRGIRPENIPFSRGSGASTSKYIDGLKRFWMLRGLSPKEAVRASFATANKHKQEGMPTRSSYGFSQNGRRLGFFSGTVERNIQHIEDAVRSVADNVVRATFFNVLNKTQHEFTSATT